MYVQGCISRLQKEYKAFLKVCPKSAFESFSEADNAFYRACCRSIGHANPWSSLHIAFCMPFGHYLSQQMHSPQKIISRGYLCCIRARLEFAGFRLTLSQAKYLETLPLRYIHIQGNGDQPLYVWDFFLLWELWKWQEPPPGIKAHPNSQNILEWHYAIEGHKGSAFEGGIYHGKPNDKRHFFKPIQLKILFFGNDIGSAVSNLRWLDQIKHWKEASFFRAIPWTLFILATLWRPFKRLFPREHNFGSTILWAYCSHAFWSNKRD